MTTNHSFRRWLRLMISPCLTGVLLLGLLLVGAGPMGNAAAMGSILQDEKTSTKIDQSPLRTWSSADGKFQQEGRLVEHLGERVRLQTDKGESIVAPIAKLCEDDQKFIQQELDRANQAGNPFMVESSSDNPFSGKSTESGNKSGTVTKGGANKKPRNNPSFQVSFFDVPTVDLNTSKSIDLSQPRWQTATVTKSFNKFRIPSYSFHASVTGNSSNRDLTVLAVSFYEPFGITLGEHNRLPGRATSDGAAKIETWAHLLSLPEGRTLAQFPLPTKHALIGDVAPSGQRLLILENAFAGEPQVFIMQADEAGEFTVEASWPSLVATGRKQKVEKGAFLDENHVVLDYRDHLQVWQLEPLGLKHLVPNNSENWKLSNERTHALVVASDQQYEVDLIQGQCTGTSTNSISVADGTPSADGQRLAKFHDSTITINDSNGTILQEFFVPIQWHQPQVSWVDQQTLLVTLPHQMYYVDLDRRAVFLELNKHSVNQSNSPWSFEKSQHGADQVMLVSYMSSSADDKLNLEKYRQKLPTASDVIELLKKGDRVKVSINMGGTPELAAKARDSIDRMLQARGVTIDPRAEIEIVATATNKNETIEYRRFGVPPWSANGVEKVQVRRVDQRLEISQAKNIVFRKLSSTGASPILNMKEGETVQEAADRQNGNPALFWEQLKVPQSITSHPKGQAWTRLNYVNGKYTEIE